MSPLARRWAISFTILGMVYLAMEVVARAVRGEMVGCHEFTWVSLAGWSSVWMFPIGGTCAVILGALSEYQPYIRLWLQCLLGTIFIFAIEFGAGLIFNVWLGLGLWDYSAWPLNIMGQVTLVYLPIWYMVCPAAIWLDDVLARGIGAMSTKDTLWRSYLYLFSGM